MSIVIIAVIIAYNHTILNPLMLMTFMTAHPFSLIDLGCQHSWQRARLRYLRTMTHYVQHWFTWSTVAWCTKTLLYTMLSYCQQNMKEHIFMHFLLKCSKVNDFNIIQPLAWTKLKPIYRWNQCRQRSHECLRLSTHWHICIYHCTDRDMMGFKLQSLQFGFEMLTVLEFHRKEHTSHCTWLTKLLLTMRILCIS